MRFTPARILAGVIILLLVVGGIVLITTPSQYTATAFLPAGNPNIIEGAPILVNGFHEGKVVKLVPEGQGAELTIGMDKSAAPLHTGAVVFVQWSAAVGERLIQVNDGPPQNPAIPDGGRIEGTMPQPMELSDVLGGLDPATRSRLGPVIQQLQTTLAGHEQDLNATLATAGPAFTAIGNVLRGVAIDEPAINQLVTDTNDLVTRAGAHDQDISGIVNDLSVSTHDTAQQRDALRQVLHKLPPTLDQARSTLGKVPGATDAAVPLLQDAKTTTDKLPSVASHLAPVLRDLRPTIAQLKPTLEAASQLLDETPGLLDAGDVTLPKVGDTFGKLTPTLKDLQPFTPCLVGFLSNWGSAAAYYDANGQYVHVPIRVGPESVDDTPVNPGGLFAKPVSRTCDPVQQGGAGGTGAAANPVAAGIGGLN
ncbi:MAG TPA: MCE family protein [Actinomycetospora sp.]|jgi:phospholipid/cholesterol/gamma-HCH transport system substrate-binding protein|uniref:MlaD family protein n=1 Tax=Actinomycetospora sp. TaxID=1872135 RepID=UPI002F42CE0F